jgi:hypothetical protein
MVHEEELLGELADEEDTNIGVCCSPAGV